MKQTSHHRDTEALRTEKKGTFLCASVSLWLMQSIFHAFFVMSANHAESRAWPYCRLFRTLSLSGSSQTCKLRHVCATRRRRLQTLVRRAVIAGATRTPLCPQAPRRACAGRSTIDAPRDPQLRRCGPRRTDLWAPEGSSRLLPWPVRSACPHRQRRRRF